VTTVRIDLRELRLAGGVMLAAGVVRGLTHSSLGLPCPLRSMTGVPCPLCGMTTSVTAASTGHIGAAVAANPAGLAAITVAVLLLAVPRVRSVDLPRWAVPGCLLAMWVWELLRFRII
jgi:hypothetical protein